MGRSQNKRLILAQHEVKRITLIGAPGILNSFSLIDQTNYSQNYYAKVEKILYLFTKFGYHKPPLEKKRLITVQGKTLEKYTSLIKPFMLSYSYPDFRNV